MVYMNDLKLTVNKTTLLHFSYFKQTPITVDYKSQLLTSAESVRFLGIEVDSQLNWTHHVSNLSAGLSSFNYALRIIAASISTSAALCAYFAYVHSRIRYGVIFWGVSVEAIRVFNVQKRCLRTIFNRRKTETCKDLFVENGILTLAGVYIYECALFVKENYELFGDLQQEHGYNTRGIENQHILPPQTKKTLIKKV